MTVHTHKHTNERRSQGTLTSVLTIARGKTENRNKTQTVCSLDFHDNNKLMEFTSHLLFILFDGVVGDLHGREILERIQEHLGCLDERSCFLQGLLDVCFHLSHLNVNKRYFLFLSSPVQQLSTRHTTH